MKRIRPVEIEKCMLCGREFDKMLMDEVFTGRMKYVCLECKRRGSRQVDARRETWRNSARGKYVISRQRKNR